MDNFFYVNPYVNGGRKLNGEEKLDEANDVFYDKKKNKIVVKDLLPYGKSAGNNEFDIPNEKKMLNKKRNVAYDNRMKIDDNDDVKISKKRTDLNQNEINRFNKNTKNSHSIKFSGEEYTSKGGKGDKLIKGKYDPFAYIQLNPKATSKKQRKDALAVFEKIMKK